MKLRGRQLVIGTSTVLLALCMLVGCAALGEPTSTEDLLVRFAANPNNTNFVAKGGASLALTLSGYRAAVPIEGTVLVADDKALCNVSVDLSSFASEKRAYEIYVEAQGTSGVFYLRDSKSEQKTPSSSVVSRVEESAQTDEKDEQQTDFVGELEENFTTSDIWNRAQIDVSFDVDIPLVVDVLSQAKFMRASYASDDQICYDLTIPAKDALHAVLSRGEITTTFCEVNEDELASILGDSKLHVCFNKDCLIRSVALDLDFTYDDKETIPVPVHFDIELSATFDDYGTVDLSQVAASEEVREAATNTSDPFDVDGLAEKLQSSAA